MPAEHYVDNNAKLIITSWVGVAVDIEFIDAIKKYQEEIQSNPNYSGYNEVVNFSKVTNIKLTRHGIKSIGQIASKTDKNNTKLALIVSSNLAYNLARMYQGYRYFFKNSTKEVRVFKHKNEAFDWAQNNT